MMKILLRLFLVSTSIAFCLLMASFYFFGLTKTVVILGISTEIADTIRDKSFGDSKKTVKIDNHSFKIPEEYVAIATRAKGKLKNDVQFHTEVIWPSFTPRRLISPEEYKKAVSEKRNAFLYITKAWPEKTAKHLSIKPNEGGIVDHKLEKEEHGFDKYIYHVKIKPSSDETKISNGISYILKAPDNNIIEHVECYGPHPPLNKSSCTYHFIDKGLLYNVRFNDSANEESFRLWKQKTINFIDQYRTP